MRILGDVLDDILRDADAKRKKKDKKEEKWKEKWDAERTAFVPDPAHYTVPLVKWDGQYMFNFYGLPPVK